MLECGGRLVGAIPSFDACILAWVRGCSFRIFRTISFTFEAVRGEYLSRTHRATQRSAILSMLQKEIYGKPYVRRISDVTVVTSI